MCHHPGVLHERALGAPTAPASTSCLAGARPSFLSAAHSGNLGKTPISHH